MAARFRLVNYYNLPIYIYIYTYISIIRHMYYSIIIYDTFSTVYTDYIQ